MRAISPCARACALALALLGVDGCGAGGSTEPEPDLPHFMLLRIYATPELDGVVWSDGTVDTDGGNLVTGDLDGVTNGLAARQFFSFDLTRPCAPKGRSALRVLRRTLGPG